MAILAFLPAAGCAQEYSAVAPTFSIGGSIFEFDERGPYYGVAARAGIGVVSYFDLVLTVEHWASLGSLVGWSSQLEGALYPVGRRVVSPRVILGTGWFWASPEGSSTSRAGFNGSASSFGLGVRVWPGGSLAFNFDALVRFDAGVSGNAELRGLVEYTPGTLERRPLAGRGRVALLALGMVPVAGPWRFTEPGYAVRFATPPLAGHHSGSLAVALLHLRIPHPTIEGAYGWDTRAVLINPGWQWDTGSQLGQVSVRAGPALTLMFEGPDQGMRAGARIEIGTTVRLGPVPVTVGAGWLWTIRGETASASTPGTDLHGVILSAGIGS